MPRPGRRGGDADSRGTIIKAARAEFLESGYNAATIRAIARRAEVDPALIYHFFTDKPTLYAATLHLPTDPRAIQNEVRAADAGDGARAGGSPGGETQQGAASSSVHAGRSAGATLVERFLSQWETGPGAPGQSFVTTAQATSSSPEVARSVREYLFDRVWGNVPGSAEAEWGRTMISSLLLGMAWNRYVLRTEPIASASLAEIAAWFGPLIDSIRSPVTSRGESMPGSAEGS